MTRSHALLAILTLASSSCSQEAAPETFEITVGQIAVDIGDSREDVSAAMGLPNAVMSEHSQGEILDVVVMGLTDNPSERELDRLKREARKDFEANPAVYSSPIWRYYGYGSNDQFAAIYFKEDTVIGITLGMTQDMIGNGYAQ
tara:strand:+ start:720 stop:1151 length:432 start_codon:yes stop_codon:yes gene_type:complete